MDATIIRCFVVPAMMSYSGDSTWWAPAWIDKAARLLVPEESRVNEERTKTYSAEDTIDSADTSGNPIHDSVGSSSDWEKI